MSDGRDREEIAEEMAQLHLALAALWQEWVNTPRARRRKQAKANTRRDIGDMRQRARRVILNDK